MIRTKPFEALQMCLHADHPEGGTVIAAGPPEKIANTPGSHTGEYLKPRLENPSTPLIDLPMAGKKIAGFTSRTGETARRVVRKT